MQEHANDFMEIKNIGKEQPTHPYMKKNNFAYTPSSSICVYYTNDAFEGFLPGQFRGKGHFFTFIDLVNKVTFNLKIEITTTEHNQDRLNVINFYFSDENDFVIVSSFKEKINQLTYKVNYSNQEWEHQDTISYKFIQRDYNHCGFSYQTNKFLRLDGIDYIVLLDEDSDPDITVCMIPKYPADRNSPIKEYKFCITKEEYNQIGRERINPYLWEEGENDEERGDEYYNDQLSFFPHIESCLIKGTKLTLRYQFDNAWKAGELIGEYLEIDLSKLKDISKMKFETETDFREFIADQGKVFESVQRGDVFIALAYANPSYDIQFWQSQNDIGTIYIVRSHSAQ